MFLFEFLLLVNGTSIKKRGEFRRNKILKYKIIAVDMDGTLLDDDKHISDYNLKMIEKAVSLGVKFVIASGRLPCGLKFYEATVAKNQPMLCCNGGLILDEYRNSIYSNFLSREALLKIIYVLRTDKDTYYHFYSDDSIFSEHFGHEVERFYKFNNTVDRKYRIEIRLIPDAKQYIEKTNIEVNKIVVIDEDLSYLKSLRERIESIEGVEVTKSNIDNIEINSEGTNKGTGLKLLAEHYGISIEECIAVGNDENDISMIKCAGLGVAVQNARDYIKETADFITERDNNNGAIGEVIEKFILNEQK